MLSVRGLLKATQSWPRFLWTARARDNELVLSEAAKGALEGEEGRGRELRLPHAWLRDNCQCPACFHAPSCSRVIDIERFDFTVWPLKFNVTADDEWLDVRWSDGHESRYGLGWLRARPFGPQPHDLVPGPRPWTADQFPQVMHRYSYDDIIHSDESLLGWLESLAVRGLAVVEGAGSDEGKLRPLAERIAFLKRTYYGETFSVRAKPGTGNVAYLAGALQLHTDLPYYNHKPGINLLHCLSQGEGAAGGESELADGLSACDWLRATHPHHYWILATVPVRWEDVVCEAGRRFHAVHLAPVICESAVTGEVERVNWSQPQRGSMFAASVDRCAPWYAALRVFVRRLHDPQCKFRYRLRPGEILTFDNLRVLHGRTTYVGDRRLEGGYVDWDLVRSKIRVLRSRADADPPPSLSPTGPYE